MNFGLDVVSLPEQPIFVCQIHANMLERLHDFWRIVGRIDGGVVMWSDTVMSCEKSDW